jgi:ATP-dependent Lon protease
MFVTTANTLNMPQPLLDRMEIIRISGYTEDEKVEIAKRHLIPKQIEAHGLKEGELIVHRGGAARPDPHYTREAGVRTLEREIAKVAARRSARSSRARRRRSRSRPDNLGDFLGVRRFRHGDQRGGGPDRRVTGLAWTEVGGELLTIEAVTVPGKGQIKTTGKLGDVMQESIQAAFSSCGRARAELRRQAEPVQPQGHPRPRARGRGAQGRPLGRRRHGHRDHLGADRHPGPPRRRHDRRGHAARPGAADRRAQGEAARGAARRHQEGADPGGEREGPGRDPGQRSAKGWRSSPSPMSTRCWPTRWRRRSSRSNGPRPTSWRPLPPPELAAAPEEGALSVRH